MHVKIDRILRSRRRTVSLEISDDASLVVRAPQTAPLDLINRFVLEKSDWISRKQSDVRQRCLQAAPKRFIPGEEFLYLGRSYRLALVNDSQTPLSLDGDFRLSTAHTHHPKLVFTNWYRKEAYRTIGERLELYDALSGLPYRSYRITDARKRWGSCGLDNSLSFAWRLIMAPLYIIDYVVAHELAHIAEHNHSRRFWALVGTMHPGYRDSRRWLRENGHALTV